MSSCHKGTWLVKKLDAQNLPWSLLSWLYLTQHLYLPVCKISRFSCTFSPNSHVKWGGTTCFCLFGFFLVENWAVLVVIRVRSLTADIRRCIFRRLDSATGNKGKNMLVCWRYYDNPEHKRSCFYQFGMNTNWVTFGKCASSKSCSFWPLKASLREM